MKAMINFARKNGTSEYCVRVFSAAILDFSSELSLESLIFDAQKQDCGRDFPETDAVYQICTLRIANPL